MAVLRKGYIGREEKAEGFKKAIELKMRQDNYIIDRSKAYVKKDNRICKI